MKLPADQIEEFTEDYKVNLLTLTELCEKYQMRLQSLHRVIDTLQLSRDESIIRSRVNKQTKHRIFEELKQKVTANDLKEFYITQDNSYEDTAEHFEISYHYLDRLLREYNLKKPRTVSCKKGLLTKYENAGGKDNYTKQILDARDKTIESKYGSKENYYQLIKQNTEENNLKKYGFKYKCTADLISRHSEKYQKLWHDEQQSINYLASFTSKPSLEQLALELNCSINCIHLWIEKYNLSKYITFTKSHYEEDVIDYIDQFGLKMIRNDRKVLNGKELDIYIPERNLAIEFNGDYWHSSDKVGKNYHFNKSFICEQKNIRLIHIYQYQWLNSIKQEILKSIIKNALNENENIIYARKCNIVELTKKDVQEFSELNSLHGHRNASIYLGLKYDNELVQIMTFGKAFFSRDDSIDYECIRSISKLNTTIVGGMNKLFKYFLKKYNPNKVLYYVDYNTHNGSSMSKLGFEFIGYSKHGCINIANCKEIAEKYGQVFGRKPEKNKEIQEYIKQGKILPIYDAGVKKYIWSKK